MITPPFKKVRIAGRDWDVAIRTREELPGLCGQAVLIEGRIDIAEWVTDYDTKDTVLHEVIHTALYRHSFKRTGEVEENFVGAISTELMGIFQDNPEFAQWLIEPLTKS